MNQFVNKILIISFLVLSVSAIAVFTTYQTTYDNSATTPSYKFAKEKQVLLDDKGNPKYAEGECQSNSDCYSVGCYLHICTSNAELKPICEYKEDFPSSAHNCFCLENLCVWIK